MSQITFAFTEEQELLRDTARKFLSSESDVEKVRQDMDTDEGFDPALWSQAAQMGWTAMAVPEEYGGAGYGWAEVGVLMEQMGRALFCAPYLSSAVMSVAALRAAGSEAQRKEHLPGLASGEVRATVAHVLAGNEVTADGTTLSGTVTHVLDGHTADLLLVPARSGDQWSLFLVHADADGVTRQLVPTLDQTRKQATLTFDAAAAELVGDPGAGRDILHEVATVGAVMVACEQVGGAQYVFEESTEYAKTRKQFGRAIGSFQAIKHRLAETLIRVESAKSVAYHAARALDGDDADEVAIAAPMAASYCSEVFEQAAGDNIQNHGGIAFTWEHDAHLYFKRAKTTKLLFGGGTSWRARLADTLGL